MWETMLLFKYFENWKLYIKDKLSALGERLLPKLGQVNKINNINECIKVKDFQKVKRQLKLQQKSNIRLLDKAKTAIIDDNNKGQLQPSSTKIVRTLSLDLTIKIFKKKIINT